MQRLAIIAAFLILAGIGIRGQEGTTAVTDGSTTIDGEHGSTATGGKGDSTTTGVVSPCL